MAASRYSPTALNVSVSFNNSVPELFNLLQLQNVVGGLPHTKYTNLSPTLQNTMNEEGVVVPGVSFVKNMVD